MRTLVEEIERVMLRIRKRREVELSIASCSRGWNVTIIETYAGPSGEFEDGGGRGAWMNPGSTWARRFAWCWTWRWRNWIRRTPMPRVQNAEGTAGARRARKRDGGGGQTAGENPNPPPSSPPPAVQTRPEQGVASTAFVDGGVIVLVLADGTGGSSSGMRWRLTERAAREIVSDLEGAITTLRRGHALIEQTARESASCGD